MVLVSIPIPVGALWAACTYILNKPFASTQIYKQQSTTFSETGHGKRGFIVKLNLGRHKDWRSALLSYHFLSLRLHDLRPHDLPVPSCGWNCFTKHLFVFFLTSLLAWCVLKTGNSISAEKPVLTLALHMCDCTQDHRPASHHILHIKGVWNLWS